VAYSDEMRKFVAVIEIVEENETFVAVAAVVVVVVVLMDHPLYHLISFRLNRLVLVYHQHHLTALNNSELDLVIEIDVILVVAVVVDKTFVKDENNMDSFDIEMVLAVVVSSVYLPVLLLMH
jgi:hypothetical protein